MTHAMLTPMKESGWGRSINFRSGSVFSGVPGQTHYVAAKAGLIGFSRCPCQGLVLRKLPFLVQPAPVRARAATRMSR